MCVCQYFVVLNRIGLIKNVADCAFRNDDPDVEDFGNKWTLGALLRYLRSEKRDTTGTGSDITTVCIVCLSLL